MRALVLNKAFDIHAWSAFGRVCFQSGGSRISVKGKFKKYIHLLITKNLFAVTTECTTDCFKFKLTK